MANGAESAKAMLAWAERVGRNWKTLHVGTPDIGHGKDALVYTVPIYLGDMDADDTEVGIYANPGQECRTWTRELFRGAAIPGTTNGYLYTGSVPASRPAEHYTVRVVPRHPGVRVPTELPLILWQR